MAVLVERRRDSDVIAWFLVTACGVAAWRGASEAPVPATLMGALAVVACGGWIRSRCRPPRQLTITADEITWGRPDRVLARIPRTAGPLDLRRSRVVQCGWWLSPSPGSGASGISMLGFDLDQVRQTCRDRGWEFEH
jgi:hypothetical protein